MTGVAIGNHRTPRHRGKEPFQFGARLEPARARLEGACIVARDRPGDMAAARRLGRLLAPLEIARPTRIDQASLLAAGGHEGRVGRAAELLLRHDRVGRGALRLRRTALDRALGVARPGLEAAVEDRLLAVADELQRPVHPCRRGEIGRGRAGRNDDDVVMRLDAEAPGKCCEMRRGRQHARRIADLRPPAIGRVVGMDGAGDVARLESLPAAIGGGSDIDDDEVFVAEPRGEGVRRDQSCECGPAHASLSVCDASITSSA